MPVESTKELLRHLLAEAYDSELQILPLLDQIETETSDSDVRAQLRQYRNDTRQQIDTIERSFELIGGAVPKATAFLVPALRDEKRELLAAFPSTQLVELYNIAVLAKAAATAAASYRALCAIAGSIRHNDVQRLLERSLAVEVGMAEWCNEAFARGTGGGARPLHAKLVAVTP